MEFPLGGAPSTPGTTVSFPSIDIPLPVQSTRDVPSTQDHRDSRVEDSLKVSGYDRADGSLVGFSRVSNPNHGSVGTAQ